MGLGITSWKFQLESGVMCPWCLAPWERNESRLVPALLTSVGGCAATVGALDFGGATLLWQPGTGPMQEGEGAVRLLWKDCSSPDRQRGEGRSGSGLPLMPDHWFVGTIKWPDAASANFRI